MDEEFLKSLEEEAKKKAPMTPRTIRLPNDLDREIQAFCSNRPELPFSVLVRGLIERAWRAMT